jgi:ATP-dependent protease ClpP protease subunit
MIGKPKEDFDFKDLMMDSTVTQIRVEETQVEKFLRLNFDAATRTIWIDGEIDTEFGTWFRKMVWTLEQASHDPITVWLNTPGGDVPSMFAFYDAVVATPCEVTIIGCGEVISAGVLMLVCGDRRLVTENCVLMSHQGADFESGGLNYKEMLERKKYWDWTMTQWNYLMARHTPYDAQYWKAITSKKAEFWLLGGRAIKDHGLADDLYEPSGKLWDRFPEDEDAPILPIEEE